MVPLPDPSPVYNGDGTNSGRDVIRDMCTLHLSIKGHCKDILFLVHDLDDLPIYLGHDWLQQHNPTLDWVEGTIEFDRCSSKCDMIPATDMDDIVRNTPLANGDHIFEMDYKGYFHGEDRPLTVKRIRRLRTEPPWMTSEYPARYFADFPTVFSEEAFNQLPPRRPWDHAIDLTPDFVAGNCKIYPLATPEQQALDEFLEENLRTGRIRPSTSPMASPFFFVKKKDGKLRPVQDYRKLNSFTIKN